MPPVFSCDGMLHVYLNAWRAPGSETKTALKLQQTLKSFSKLKLQLIYRHRGVYLLHT